MTTVRNVFSIACPQCGSDTALKIKIVTWVDVTPDGTIDNGWTDHEWGDWSRCFCTACDREGYIREFGVRNGGAP